MSTPKIKKQNRILYGCLIVLLVTASVLVAITSASNKSEKKNLPTTPSEKMEETDKLPQMATPKETEKDDDSQKTNVDNGKEESSNEKKPDDSSKKEPVSANPDEIEFTSPANGAVYNLHSLTTPVFSSTMNDYRTHTGVDIACDAKAEVYACADGVVEDVWEDPMMGYCMKLSHSADTVSIYKNLSSELPEGIEKGSVVAAGQVIACIGDSALIECEDEPHLHFELSVAGSSVDPMEYIQMNNLNTAYED